MNIKIANKTEFNEIRSFYHKVIDPMQGAEYKLAWEKGVYPSDSYLMESLENGELWVCEYDKRILIYLSIHCKVIQSH